MEVPHHVLDPAALGEWLGVAIFALGSTIMGLVARKYAAAIREWLRPPPERPRLERPSAERHRAQLLREQVHTEIFSAIKAVQVDLDQLEEKVNANAEVLADHLQQVAQNLERVKVLEVEGEHMREAITEIKSSAIRDRQEFLTAIAATRAALDNLSQITVRQLGQRVGDPFGVPRGGLDT